MLSTGLGIICSLAFVTKQWKLLIFFLKYDVTENGPGKNFINPLRNNVAPGMGGFLQRTETGFGRLWQINSREILTRATKEVCELGYYSNGTALFP